MATVAGIINGTGSIGAAVMQYAVAWISNVGWNYVFVILGIMLVVGCLCLVKLFLTEMREIVREWTPKQRTLEPV